MGDLRSVTGWRTAIARRVREREVRRRMLYNRGRKISHKYLTRLVPKKPSTLSGEFLKMWLGSLAAFWIIARLLALVPHVNSVIVLLLFGLLFSMQATYYKHKLSRDPNFKIPKCACSGRKDDNTETVLRSSDSALLGIPNAWLGAAFYVALVVLIFMKYAPAAIYVAGAGILASGFLSYVMVTRIKALCALCVNTAALNLLIFVEVWLRWNGRFHHL